MAIIHESGLRVHLSRDRIPFRENALTSISLPVSEGAPRSTSPWLVTIDEATSQQRQRIIGIVRRNGRDASTNDRRYVRT